MKGNTRGNKEPTQIPTESEPLPKRQRTSHRHLPFIQLLHLHHHLLHLHHNFLQCIMMYCLIKIHHRHQTLD